MTISIRKQRIKMEQDILRLGELAREDEIYENSLRLRNDRDMLKKKLRFYKNFLTELEKEKRE